MKWRASALLVFLALCSILVVGTSAALAHATLLGSDPADGAILRDAPSRFVLTFNEPVSPLVIRLVDPDGSATALTTRPLEEAVLTIDVPHALRAGTHALAWRVVSADGHPVRGSLIFSIGALSPGALPDVAEIVDWPLRMSIWIARVLIYVGLFAGVGGLFHAAFLGPVASQARNPQTGLISIALVALAVSVGLQGLDALGVPLAGLTQPLVWRTGFGGSYATAALLAGLALLIGLIGLRVKQVFILRTLAVVALAAVGGALASTGHASAAHPQWLTRPSVFLHVTGIAAWIGALLPLAFSLRHGGGASAAALNRFSRIAPALVALVVATGLAQAVIQIGRPTALWTTAYGRVFLAKFALLVCLFALAAFNRWRLTLPAAAGDPRAARSLARCIKTEIAIALAILCVVAAWRFTPPPRALAAAAAHPASVHLQTAQAMADVTITPGRAGIVSASIVIMAGDYAPLDAKEVTLILSNPAAPHIAPIRRAAAKPGDGSWRVEDLTIPVTGRWSMEIAIVGPDTQPIELQGTIDVR